MSSLTREPLKHWVMTLNTPIHMMTWLHQ